MKRILTSYFILISIFAFSQSLTTINKVSKNQEKKTISSNREVINKTKLIDTTTLNFENKEITIPSNRQNTTKIVIVKEKEKTDWLKYSLPVFTLLLGVWIKEILEKHSNKTKIKKSGERWIAELRSLKEPLEQQIKSLQKFQTENDTNEFEIPNLGLYSSVSGDIFKSLDKSELIKFIEQNNKDLDFKKIVKISNRTNGYISILEHLYKTVNEKFDSYLLGISKHTNEFTKNMQAFNIAFGDYGVHLEQEIGGEPINDPRYKPLSDLYTKHIIPHLADGNFNPYILDEQFFLPAINILSNFRLEPQTKPLANVISACLSSIKGLKMEKHYITENIKVLIRLYKEQLIELDEITSQFEKH